jgi:hypothetical protein
VEQKIMASEDRTFQPLTSSSHHQAVQETKLPSLPSLQQIVADRSSGSETSDKLIELRLDRLLSLLEILSGKNRREGEINCTESDKYLNSNSQREYVRMPQDKVELLQHVLEALHSIEPIIQDRLQHERQESLTGCPFEEFCLPSEALAHDMFGDRNAGYLTLQDGGQCRYFGSTYWAYLSDDSSHLNQLFRDQSIHMRSGKQVNEFSYLSNFSPGYAVKVNHESAQQRSHRAEHIYGEDANLHAEGLPIIDSFFFQPSFPGDASVIQVRRIGLAVDVMDILEGIPSKSQSHVLFRCWYSGVHALYPLVYIPLLMTKYQQFWSWCENRMAYDTDVPDLDFLPLLFAIWYGGSASLSINGLRKWFPGINRSTLSNFFHDRVNRSLIKISFPKVSSLVSLAAFLIARMIREREEDLLLAGFYLGLALRASLTMGLHRDPELFGIPIWEAEMRRRIWWHVILKDNILALTSGLPTLVDEQCFSDTRSISEVKEEKLGTPEASNYALAVADGHYRLAAADHPLRPESCSIVDVHYITCRGMHIIASKLYRRPFNGRL